MGEAIDGLAARFRLTEEERRQLLPSGRQRVFHNRVAWARTYLVQARLLESAGRGRFRISERGREVLASRPARIDIKFLDQYPEFREFRSRKGPSKTLPDTAAEGRTPDEQMEAAFERHRQALKAELLERLRSSPPSFFERVVVDTLVAMGYGGSREDMAWIVGGSGDEGIDGVIHQDPLGLDVIYVQAKRWGDRTVGRPVVEAFVGALQGRQASKGVLITTGSFTKEAKEFARRIPNPVVLVDGDRLAELMIEHGVGVRTAVTYEVKRIDNDYFGVEA